MAAISQTIYSNAFLWMKNLVLIQISLTFVPKGPFDNKAALVQVMAWCWISDKPFSEPMLTQYWCICGTQRKKVNSSPSWQNGSNITDDNFKCNFNNENWLISTFFFTAVCSLGCDWRYVSIRSDNGLAPKRLTSLMISQHRFRYWLGAKGNKPLPKPMLTQISVAIWCH